jgi:hypothetical protein
MCLASSSPSAVRTAQNPVGPVQQRGISTRDANLAQLREEMTAGSPLRVEAQQQRQQERANIPCGPVAAGFSFESGLARRTIPTCHGVRKSTHFSSLD